MKNVLIAVGAVLLLVGGGLFFAISSGMLHFGAAPAPQAEVAVAPVEPAPAPRPPAPALNTVEVSIPGIIISINRERRQSLLLLDLTLVVDELYVETVEKQRSKVVNSVIKLLNYKEEEYFYKSNFIDVSQRDIQQNLGNTLGVLIDEVLITKAVYQ